MVRPKKQFTTTRMRVSTPILGVINAIGDSMVNMKKAALMEYVTEQSEWSFVGENIQTIFDYAKHNGFDATYNNLMVAILTADGCKHDDIMIQAYRNDQGAIQRLIGIQNDLGVIQTSLMAPLYAKNPDFLGALEELEVDFDTVMENFKDD